MKRKWRFLPGKKGFNFQTDWAVYPVKNDRSLCYTTGKIQARLIALALTRFMNSDEGRKWWQKEVKDKGL